MDSWPLGAIASVAVPLVNVRRLLADIADRLGPWLWLASMALLLGYTLLPLVRMTSGWLSVVGSGSRSLSAAAAGAHAHRRRTASPPPRCACPISAACRAHQPR